MPLENALHFLAHGHSPYESSCRLSRLQAAGDPFDGFALPLLLYIELQIAVPLENALHFLAHGHSPYESSFRLSRLQAAGDPSDGFALLIAFVNIVSYILGFENCKLSYILRECPQNGILQILFARFRRFCV